MTDIQMRMHFQCPACGKNVQTSKDILGKKVRCSGCKTIQLFDESTIVEPPDVSAGEKIVPEAAEAGGWWKFASVSIVLIAATVGVSAYFLSDRGEGAAETESSDSPTNAGDSGTEDALASGQVDGGEMTRNESDNADTASQDAAEQDRFPEEVDGEKTEKRNRVVFDVKPLLSASVSALCWKSEGEIFVGTAEGKITLVSAENGKTLREFQGHSQRVTGLEYVSQAQKLVSCSSDRTVCIWDAGSGRELRKIDITDDHYPIGVASNSDTSRVATVSGNSVYVWTASDGKRLANVASNAIYTTAQQNTARTADGLRALFGKGSALPGFADLAFLDDDVSVLINYNDPRIKTNPDLILPYLVLNSDNGRYRLFRSDSLHSGLSEIECYRTKYSGEGRFVTHYSHSICVHDPRGPYAYMRKSQKVGIGYVKILDLALGGDVDQLLQESRDKLPRLRIADIKCAAMAHSGRFIVSGHADGRLIFRDANSLKAMSAWQVGFVPIDLSISPDESNMCVVSSDGTLFRFTYDSAVAIRPIAASGGYYYHGYRGMDRISISPDSSRIHCWCIGTGELFDIDPLTMLETSHRRGAVFPSPFITSKNGTLIGGAAGNDFEGVKKGIHLVSMKTAKSVALYPSVIQEPKRGRLVFNLAAISRDGRRVAISGFNGFGVFKVGETKPENVVNDKEFVQLVRGHGLHSAALANSGGMLAIPKINSSELWFWKKDIGPKLLEGHKNIIRDTTFSEDGRYLVSGDNAGTVIVWDTATLKQAAKFELKEYPGGAVEISPDGNRIVTANRVGRVVMWDRESGRVEFDQVVLANEIGDIVFAPNGQFFTCCSHKDGGIYTHWLSER